VDSTAGRSGEELEDNLNQCPAACHTAAVGVGNLARHSAVEAVGIVDCCNNFGSRGTGPF